MTISELLSRSHVVKIDGLREVEHAVAAAAGADLLGFIFAPARRQVSAATAKTCIEAAREVNSNILAVGVFVNAAPSDIRDVVDEAGLDVVQLHGDEHSWDAAQFGVPVLKALRPKDASSANDIIARIDAFQKMPIPPSGYLIDGYAEGVDGGSGVRADWRKAAVVCAQKRVMLAGGLTPDNVGEAIRRVRPAGVDVSSGVETAGKKDVALIEAFIREARIAFSTAFPY